MNDAEQLQAAAACATPFSETSGTALAPGPAICSRRAAKSRSAPVLVDVGDGDRRMLDAQHRDQLGGRQRRAAEREEVAVGADRDRAELLAPVLRQPPLGFGQRRRLVAAAGRRPGQRLAVDLARRRDGSSSSTTIIGTRLAGIRSATSARTASACDRPGHVADQQLVAGGGLRTTVQAARTPGVALSASSISPSSIRRPPILTWWSRRPTNASPSSVLADDVAGAVGALPAQRGQAGGSARRRGRRAGSGRGRRRRSRALRPRRRRPAVVGIDDGELPAAQRLADRHRLARIQADRRSTRRWPRSARRCSTARACRRAAPPAAPGTPRRRGSAGARRRAPRRPRSRPASARSR